MNRPAINKLLNSAACLNVIALYAGSCILQCHQGEEGCGCIAQLHFTKFALTFSSQENPPMYAVSSSASLRISPRAVTCV